MPARPAPSPRTERDAARYREAERALWAHHGMPDPVEHRVEVPGLGIGVRVVTHGEGRPVVFVHGNQTSGATVVPLVEALPGIRAIVVDRPGCGLSDPLDYARMTAADLRYAVDAYLTAVIEELAGEPVDLVGSSAGGAAVLHEASEHPELTRSVALVGVPVIMGMQLPLMVKTAAVTSRAASRLPRRVVTAGGIKGTLRTVGHPALARRGGLTGPDLEWRLALAHHTNTLRNEVGLLGRAAGSRGLRPDWVAGRATITSLQVPSLWVFGDRDPYASPARVKAWASHAPDSTVRVMMRAGHMPWMDDAPGTARLLTRWWARVAPEKERTA